jgi:hypothetical protein
MAEAYAITIETISPSASQIATTSRGSTSEKYGRMVWVSSELLSRGC